MNGIRIATTADIPAMMKINLESLRENYPYDEWEEWMQENHSFVAVVNDEIVGYVLCDLHGDIGSLAIQSSHRRQGHARRLMRACIDHYEGETMILYVREHTNPHALRLYESLGFQVTNKKECYYEDDENALVMIKKKK